jgi:hypothetical protein
MKFRCGFTYFIDLQNTVKRPTYLTYLTYLTYFISLSGVIEQ